MGNSQCTEETRIGTIAQRIYDLENEKRTLETLLNEGMVSNGTDLHQEIIALELKIVELRALYREYQDLSDEV